MSNRKRLDSPPCGRLAPRDDAVRSRSERTTGRKRLGPQAAAAARLEKVRRQDDRDHQIFDLVTIWHHTQAEVAERFQLTQARVSQIVRDIKQRTAAIDAQAASPRGVASQRLQTRWACRRRREWALAEAKQRYDESDQPLVTVKTRRDGQGQAVYTDTTERHRPKDHQLLKTIIKLNHEIAQDADLPPPPSADEATAAAARAQQLAAAREEAQAQELADLNEQAAQRRARDQQQQEALEATRRIYATPQSKGQHYARVMLEGVIAGRLSLADAETCNHESSLSDGAEYPSYYEKLDENINGVRVADWVHELVPAPRLPQGDDVWLPIYHCLKDWDPFTRRIEPHATNVRVNDDPSGMHYGAECGSTVSVEQDGPQEVIKSSLACAAG